MPNTGRRDAVCLAVVAGAVAGLAIVAASRRLQPRKGPATVGPDDKNAVCAADGPYVRDRRHRLRFQSTGARKTHCVPSRHFLKEAIPAVVPPGADVLVVGLDPEVIALVAECTSGAVVAIDMGRAGYGSYLRGSDAVPLAGDRCSTLTVDPWDVPALVRLGVPFGAAVLDVMGLAGRDATLDTIALLNQYWRAFPGLRTMLVKSRALQELGATYVDAKLVTGVRPHCGEADGWLHGKVVCAVGVAEYRATIPFVVRTDDCVLEMQRLTVLYVDISGLSGRNCLFDALALVDSYRRLLRGLRTVVVKSRSLRDVTDRFVDAVALLSRSPRPGSDDKQRQASEAIVGDPELEDQEEGAEQ